MLLQVFQFELVNTNTILFNLSPKNQLYEDELIIPDNYKPCVLIEVFFYLVWYIHVYIIHLPIFVYMKVWYRMCIICISHLVKTHWIIGELCFKNPTFWRLWDTKKTKTRFDSNKIRRRHWYTQKDARHLFWGILPVWFWTTYLSIKRRVEIWYPVWRESRLHT